MNTIVTCWFDVDVALVGMNAMNATGFVCYANKDIVTAMPRATLTSGKIYFLKVEDDLPWKDVIGEYDRHGLTPADPHTLLAFNEAHPGFSDSHHNGTQWIDPAGNLCSMDLCSRTILVLNYAKGDSRSNYKGMWLAGFIK